ncbi:MAG TPA: VOC family protein [Polyangiaceae bacterium]|nr:VOC family protein [Polyangiaceae bacterium]
MTRPFRVLGLQQVAIGGLDRALLRHLWCDLLGLPQRGSYQSAAYNVIEDILELGPADAPVEVDLMQPLDPGKTPRVHEPPLNHVGLWVDDLRAAYQYLEGRGVRFAPGGIRPGAAGHDICFIHPKPSADKPESGQGVLIELVQAPSEVIARLSRT